MIKRLLNKKFETVTFAAMVIAFFGLVSRLLGIVRDKILANQFGASNELDIYYASFRLPDLIYNLLILGVLSAGFIPVFLSIFYEDGISQKENTGAWDLVSNVLNILGFFLILLGLFFVIFAPFVVPIITPGFANEKMQATIDLTRIMMLSPIFLGLSAVLSSVLQATKRFLVFSLAPIMYNAGIIIGAIFFVPIFGIKGLAWGVVLGAFLHFIVQLPTVLSLGFRYRVIFNFRENNFVKIIKMTGPRILGLAAGQLNLVVITIFASFLPMGSLAVFNFANNLQSLPLGLFGVSFAVAAFPALSTAFNQKNLDDFRQIKQKTYRQIIFYVLPFTIWFFIFGAELIAITLSGGNFLSNQETLNALRIFCLSLPFQALLPLLARSFYATGDSWRPFWGAFVSLLVNVLFAFVGSKYFGLNGLIMAFGVSSFANFILLSFWKRESFSFSFKYSVKIILIVGALAFVAFFVRQTLQNFIADDLLWKILVDVFAG
ncbi:MAG: murein biosynthesis integral membrane protein MurJ, partial [Patescibacteria group bacterium]